MHRIVVAVIAVACGCDRDDRPTPAVAPTAPVSIQTKPEPPLPCQSGQTFARGPWTCVCATWAGPDPAWWCSNCPTGPDTTKPCTPGASCESHNVERDESFTCRSDGTWSCFSSSSNTAACAAVRR